MQPVLERGSIDKSLTFDVGLMQLDFIPVCSPNTCSISVKLRRGFAQLHFSAFHCIYIIASVCIMHIIVYICTVAYIQWEMRLYALKLCCLD